MQGITQNNKSREDKHRQQHGQRGVIALELAPEVLRIQLEISSPVGKTQSLYGFCQLGSVLMTYSFILTWWSCICMTFSIILGIECRCFQIVLLAVIFWLQIEERYSSDNHRQLQSNSQLILAMGIQSQFWPIYQLQLIFRTSLMSFLVYRYLGRWTFIYKNTQYCSYSHGTILYVTHGDSIVEGSTR